MLSIHQTSPTPKDMLAKLKNMKTASSNEQIPGTAEEILTILEALANMDKDSTDSAPPHLPQDILVHIFCALKLSVLEQLDVIGLVTAEHATVKEVKHFVNDRMIFYSIWKRTFLKADQDHRALKGQHTRRTQAVGALGGELRGKAKRRNKKKKQEGKDGEDREEDKSFGGAGLVHGGGAGSGDQRPKKTGKPRCGLCESAPGQSPKVLHWTDECPLLSARQKQKLQAKIVCQGCLRWKGPRPVKHRCPPWA